MGRNSGGVLSSFRGGGRVLLKMLESLSKGCMVQGQIIAKWMINV